MEVTSTPLRKINKKKLPELTPINNVQEDETERRNRRSLATMQKRLSQLPSQGSPLLNLSMRANVDVEEVKEHFQLCQKLFAENKINNKNAWNLKLIDYLNILISQDIFGKGLMLVATTSLDICTKVYACRVDDLYAKGLQLASTITTLEREQVVENDRIDEDSDAEGKVGKKQTKKKRKIRLSASQKHTIAKDPKSLDVPNVAKMQSVFFVGHRNIEASDNENLFTNKLPLDHVGCKIILLNKANQGMPYYGEEDPSVNQDQMTTLKINPGAFKICQAFSEFHIDEWDPDHEKAQMAEIDKTLNITASANDELVYDEQGIPIAELDGSVHDIFADEPANDDMLEEAQAEVNNAGVPNQEVEFISSFCPIDNGNFINNNLDTWWMKRVWVGPSHWKNKFIKQRAGRFTGKINNQAPPPRTKRKVEITSADIDFSNFVQIDMSKKYKSLKKVKYDAEKLLLPLNHLPLAPDHQMLLLKPFVCQKDFPAKAKEEEYEHGPYDYNNPNDSQYCSQHSVLDELDNNDEPLPENDVVHEEEHIANCERDGANMATDMLANLVEAPDMVQQTYIPYALRAKKMNMKRLKNTIWEILTEDKNSNIINIEERPAKEMNFSHLYSTLTPRLPQSMRNELSPHLAFVALLHLTNEHNLKLTGQGDLNDLMIEQEK